MSYIGSKPADKALTSADIEDGTIATADLQNNAVNATKLDLTDDYAFTGTITGAGESNTPAFLATRTSSQTVSNSVTTKLEFSTKVFDTNSCYDNVTNYRFTPNVAGKYLLFCKFMLQNTAEPVQVLCTFRKNGTTTYEGFRQTANGSEVDVTCHQILEANGTTDYFEAYVFHQAGSNRDVYGNSEQRFHFGGFLITT